MTARPVALETRSGTTLTAGERVRGSQKAWYTVFVLILVGALLQIDNRIIGLLIRPIKHDFQLSDTQIGWLTGFAFSAVYLVFGVTLARYIDRGSRKSIISIGLGIWSFAAALCGIAQTFVQLVLARMLLGAGESLNSPAALSLLSDLFPNNRLPRAIAVMTLGNVISSAASLLLSALVIHLVMGAHPLHLGGLQIHRWQLVFICVGAPGVLLAPLVFATVPEPVRKDIAQTRQTKVALAQVISHLFRNARLYGPMFIGLGVSSVTGGGRAVWDAPFFERTYGWSSVKFGTTVGLVELPVGVLGLFLGVWLVERLTRLGRADAPLLVVVLSRAISIPALIFMPIAPTPWLAVAMLAIVSFTLMSGIPSQSAALQIVTPGRMRGQVTALYLLMTMVVGTGLGPLLVGAMNDYVFHAESSLRWSLFYIHLVLAPLSIVIIASGLKAYREEAQKAQDTPPAPAPAR